MSIFFMPSEFAPPGGRPKVTKKQIQQMQENYKKAGELLEDTTEAEMQEKAILDELFEEEFENAFDVAQKVGVYVGRFQPFHKGHENVIKQMLKENDKVLIYIGTGGGAENNPYSFSECASFFSAYISDTCIVEELQDNESDEMWARNLGSFIEEHTINNSVWNFYGGDLKNDYAIQVIQSLMPQITATTLSYIEIPRDIFLIPIDGEEITLSGTQCREAIEQSNWSFLEQALPENVYNILRHT